MELTSIDNPRVKGVVRLRRQWERRRSGLFIAEGEREVSRALEAGLGLRGLYLCAEMLGSDGERRWSANRERVEGQGSAVVFGVTAPLMTKMAYRQNPEGLLGVFEQPVWRLADLPARGEGQGEVDLWLVTVGTQKPGNLGAMARSAVAAGCKGLLVCDGVVDAFNPNAIRASTGAVFELPVVAESTQGVLAFLRGRGVRVVAARLGAGVCYTEVDLTGPVALVVGPEDEGLDPGWPGSVLVGDGADEAREGVESVAIPMCGGVVDSLNASVAAGVLLFEAVRQRRGEDVPACVTRG